MHYFFSTLLTIKVQRRKKSWVNFIRSDPDPFLPKGRIRIYFPLEIGFGISLNILIQNHSKNVVYLFYLYRVESRTRFFFSIARILFISTRIRKPALKSLMILSLVSSVSGTPNLDCLVAVEIMAMLPAPTTGLIRRPMQGTGPLKLDRNSSTNKSLIN